MLFLADIVFNLHIHFLLQQICSIILEAKEEKGLSERDVASWHYIKLGRVYFFVLSNARLTSRLPPISPAPKSLTTGAATAHYVTPVFVFEIAELIGRIFLPTIPCGDFILLT